MGRIEVVKKKEKGDLGEVEKRSLGHPKLEAELGRWGLKVLTQCIIVCSSWSNMTLSVHDANNDDVGLRAVPSLERWLCWHFYSLPRLFDTVSSFQRRAKCQKNFVGRIFLYTVFPSLVSSLRSLISWDFISPLTQSSLRPGFQDGCSGDVNWHPLSSSFYHEIKILFGMCSHHEISECGKNLIKNIPASYKPTEVEGNLTIIN